MQTPLPYAEAAVVRVPTGDLSPLLLQDAPVELLIVEGETGILFTGTKQECEEFIGRQQKQ